VKDGVHDCRVIRELRGGPRNTLETLLDIIPFTEKHAVDKARDAPLDDLKRQPDARGEKHRNRNREACIAARRPGGLALTGPHSRTTLPGFPRR
jgi:hypothetical protein